MPQETLGYVKLEWTCPKCGVRNPGTEQTCTGCGAPQPQEVKFEQTQGEQISQDESLRKVAEAGPDIHCAVCGTRNPAGAAVCSQCGAELKEGTRREAGKVIGAYQASPVKQVACPNCLFAYFWLGAAHRDSCRADLTQAGCHKWVEAWSKGATKQ